MQEQLQLFEEELTSIENQYLDYPQDVYYRTKPNFEIGDVVRFRQGGKIQEGVVKGHCWNAGNEEIREEDGTLKYRPTPIEEPADNIVVQVEGKRENQIISVFKVLKPQNL
ncbi:hypothetical protein SFC65_19855 [Priestia filamentosa]|uniref:hypothetical protein n=1 Tax=Priestia filamentosa TaxID=1402861 RepID=UPI0039825A90